MKRWKLWAAPVIVLVASGWAAAQGGSPASAAPDAPKLPAFDVISVKPGDPSTQRVGIRMNPDGFTMSNVRVDLLLHDGLQLGPDQVLNEPDWARSAGWDINAKLAGEDVEAFKNMSFDERRRMFVQVLRERFGLKYHMEKRELPVYALVIAKGGPKLTQSKTSPENANTGRGAPAGRMMMGPGRVTADGSTINFLTTALSRMVGHTVVDKTGLTGRYDYTLTWTPEQGGPGGDEHSGGMMGPGGSGGPAGPQPAGDPTGPSLFTAIQEQLGLKLEPQKAMVDVVVVDHLEKPSEN